MKHPWPGGESPLLEVRRHRYPDVDLRRSHDVDSHHLALDHAPLAASCLRGVIENPLDPSMTEGGEPKPAPTQDVR